MAVTLRDIAKRLNLSHATVSFVLNDRRDVTIPEATRQRVLEMAKEMGYRPNRAARALVSGRTNIIGVWIPTIRNRFYAETLDAISTCCRREGYETLFHRAYFNDGRRPFDWPIDGVIAVDVNDCLDEISDIDSAPLVTAGAYVDRRFDTVEVDLRQGAHEMASHLIQVGGRRLVMVKPDTKPDGREFGYEEAVVKAGGTPQYVLSENTQSGRVQEAVRNFVRREGLPDGFFASTDFVALAVKRALADLGYFPPSDLVLGGYDGTIDSESSSLTTIAQPVELLAERAVALLLARIQSPNAEKRYERLAPHLVVRDTSTKVMSFGKTA